MKKSIFKFLILLSISLFFSYTSFAQTEQELSAESEKFYQNYLSQNLDAVRNEVLKTGTHKANAILRIDPFNPTIFFDMGYVIGNVGSNSKRINDILVYRKYIEMKPDDVNGYWNFATYLYKSGLVGEADKYYAKANELDANPVYISHYQRGLAAFLDGNYKQCAESMAKAAAFTLEKGDHRWTYGYLSLCQRAVGDKKNADVNLQKAMNLGGDEVKKNIEIETGEYLSASPKNCDDVEKMRREYADKDYNREKDRIKEYKEFVKLRNCYPNDGTVSSFGNGQIERNPDLKYWKAVYEARLEKSRNPAQNPFDDVSREEKSKAFSPKFQELKTAAITNRQYEKALDMSAELLLLEPQNSQVRNLRAIAFLEMPDLKLLAWREATIALALNPKSPDARLNRARVYYELKNNKDKALAEIAEAIKVMGDTYSDIYYVRGKIYYAEKEFAKAISDFDTALKIEPRHTNAAYFKNAALNPNLDPAAVISARKKEGEATIKINELYEKMTSSVNNYNYKLKQTSSKDSICRLARDQDRDLKLFRSQLKELEKSLSPFYLYWNEFRTSLGNLEININTVQETVGRQCAN